VTRLSDRLAALRVRGEKALICYVVAGDPSAARTVEIVQALDEAGVDAVELGIPFSDPLADGPTIQAAGYRALASGMTVAGVFDVVRQIRKTSAIPIVLMTYFNPALRYGVQRFARDAADSGADAVIQTDLTPEEAGPWIEAARSSNLDTVFLLAPTSTDERIDLIIRLSTGFVYCVSRTGVTGARDEVAPDLVAFLGRVRAGIARSGRDDLPVCVGFGISEPAHVRRIGEVADGAVVGSRLVDFIAGYSDNPELSQEVRSFAETLKSATRHA